jgi:hypothetical protein
MKILTLRRSESFGFSRRKEAGKTTEIRSRRVVAEQAFWYLIAFYTTWIFTRIVRAMQAADADIGFGLRLHINIIAPLHLHSLSILTESKKEPRHKHLPGSRCQHCHSPPLSSI